MANNTDVMDYVIETTATQLGISKDNVTLETIIPSIHHMTLFACVKLGKTVIVDDLSASYTVERAIEEFER